MVRRARPEDTHALVALAVATGLFSPTEADVLLRQSLDDMSTGRAAEGHHALVWTDAGEGAAAPAGCVYFGPDAHAHGVWVLWWIGVHPEQQGRGIGDVLLRGVESHATEAGGRVLIIETSGLPALERSRAFYAARGYTVCGRIPDFYGDGDDKVIYAKRLIRSRDEVSPC